MSICHVLFTLFPTLPVCNFVVLLFLPQFSKKNLAIKMGRINKDNTILLKLQLSLQINVNHYLDAHCIGMSSQFYKPKLDLRLK